MSILNSNPQLAAQLDEAITARYKCKRASVITNSESIAFLQKQQQELLEKLKQKLENH